MMASYEKRSTVRNRMRRMRKRNRENIELASLIRAYFKGKNGMKVVNAADSYLWECFGNGTYFLNHPLSSSVGYSIEFMNVGEDGSFFLTIRDSDSVLESWEVYIRWNAETFSWEGTKFHIERWWSSFPLMGYGRQEKIKDVVRILRSEIDWR